MTMMTYHVILHNN